MLGYELIGVKKAVHFIKYYFLKYFSTNAKQRDGPVVTCNLPAVFFMDRLNIRLLPEAGVNARFKAFIENHFQGNCHFAFTFFH